MRLTVPVLLLLFGLSFFNCEPVAIAHVLVDEPDEAIDVSGWQLSAAQANITNPVRTMLVLNASITEVFIEENLLIYGSLKTQNGSVLIGKHITITYGENLTVVKTSYDGKFVATIPFPVGFPAGPTAIEAAFNPEASDSGLYLPSRSSLPIRVLYHPSGIEAEIYPNSTRPLDTVEVIGRLLSRPENVSLKLRTIVIRFDSAFIGNTTTNSTGQFYQGFSIPENVSNGIHLVTILFPAIGDSFAPSNATLPLAIWLLGTRLNVTTDRTSLLSGTKITIHGTVMLTNGTLWKYGHARVYFDDSLYANETVNADGAFLSTVQLPIGINFGWHLLKVEYNPDEASISESEATVQVFVINTPLITIASGAVVAVLSLTAYRVTKKRRPAVPAARTLPKPPVTEEPSPEAYSPEMEVYSVEGLTSMIEAEHDHAAKVRRSYSLSRSMLDQKLHEEPSGSETHWEYFSRVTKKMPSVEDLFKRLSELYELAEYSQIPIGRAQSEEATKLLLKLREEIWGENSQEYGNEYQA